MSRKVIFLDIDGVLNCDKTPNPRKFPYVVDKRLLARLKRLLAKTRAQVVLTSSWRLDPRRTPGRKILADTFRRHFAGPSQEGAQGRNPLMAGGAPQDQTLCDHRR